MAGARRKGRTIALQTLYEIEIAKHDPQTVQDRLLADSALSEDNQAFVRGLVDGVLSRRQEIDGVIRKFAAGWPVDRMPPVERNILRLAIFEILFDNKVSIKVAINEAVELAKAFGSDNSAKFVNGVLGTVSTLALQRKGD